MSENISSKITILLLLLSVVFVKTQLPSFFQNSYSFTINQCTQGTSIGTVPVVSPGSYTYSTNNPSVSVSSTGQLTLANSIGSGFTFSVTVTNAAGANSASVLLTANCGNTAYSNTAPFAYGPTNFNSGSPFAGGCPSGYYPSSGACISYGNNYNGYYNGLPPQTSCPSGYLYTSGSCIYQGYGGAYGGASFCVNGVCYPSYNSITGNTCIGNYCFSSRRK